MRKRLLPKFMVICLAANTNYFHESGGIFFGHPLPIVGALPGAHETMKGEAQMQKHVKCLYVSSS